MHCCPSVNDDLKYEYMLCIQFFVCLFQEIEFFTNSLNQLKMAQTKFLESEDCVGRVNSESKGKTILVPLTSSVSFVTVCVGVHCGCECMCVHIVCVCAHCVCVFVCV